MRIEKKALILDGASTTGAGSSVNCSDYRFAFVSFATDGGGDADLTVQFQGSISDSVTLAGDGTSTITEPAFGSAQSVTNMWDYIEVIDLEDGTAYDGDTGITVSGADDYRLFQVNVDGLKYFNARITSRVEGELTIKAIFFSE